MQTPQRRKDDVAAFSEQLKRYATALRVVYKAFDDDVVDKVAVDQMLHDLERWRNVIVLALTHLQRNENIRSAYSMIHVKSHEMLDKLTTGSYRLTHIPGKDEIAGIIRTIKEKEVRDILPLPEILPLPRPDILPLPRPEILPIAPPPSTRTEEAWDAFKRYTRTPSADSLALLRTWLQTPELQTTFGFLGVENDENAAATVNILSDKILVESTSAYMATQIWMLSKAARSLPSTLPLIVRVLRENKYTDKFILEYLYGVPEERADGLRLLELIYAGGSRISYLANFFPDTEKSTGKKRFWDVLKVIVAYIFGPNKIVIVTDVHAVRYYLLQLIAIEYERGQPRASVLGLLFGLVQQLLDKWPITSKSEPLLDLIWLPRGSLSLPIAEDEVTKVVDIWNMEHPINGLLESIPGPEFIGGVLRARLTNVVVIPAATTQMIGETVGDYLTTFWFRALIKRPDDNSTRTVGEYLTALKTSMADLWHWIWAHTDWASTNTYNIKDYLVNGKNIYRPPNGLLENTNRMARFLLFCLTYGMWTSNIVTNTATAFYDKLSAANKHEITKDTSIDAMLDTMDTDTIELASVLPDEKVDSFSVVHPLFVWWTLSHRIALLNGSWLNTVRDPLATDTEYIEALVHEAIITYGAQLDIRTFIPWTNVQNEQLWTMASQFLELEVRAAKKSTLHDFFKPGISDATRKELLRASKPDLATKRKVLPATVVVYLLKLLDLFRTPATGLDTEDIPVVKAWIDKYDPSVEDKAELLGAFAVYAVMQRQELRAEITAIKLLPKKDRIEDSVLRIAILLIEPLLDEELFPQKHSRRIVEEFIQGVLGNIGTAIRPLAIQGEGSEYVPDFFNMASVVFSLWPKDWYQGVL